MTVERMTMIRGLYHCLKPNRTLL